MQTTLPEPSDAAIAKSRQLEDGILRAIENTSEGLRFSEFVEMCLYTPELGYYESDTPIFGSSGDFITAPELSSLFARALASQVISLVDANQIGNCILEFGAGSGVLCKQLLHQLAEQNRLPDQYLIVERSSRLRQRQESLLHSLPAKLRQCVRWVQLDEVQGFEGYVLANEVFDALPFDLVRWQHNQLFEIRVSVDQHHRLLLTTRPASTTIKEELYDVSAVVNGIAYQSEVCLSVKPFVESLASVCQRAVFCIVDYGFTQSEYYHPDRNMGTMVCHYRNRVHDNPLLWPGLQDISCSVNFSQVARHASACGFTPLAYSPQAHFLLANGILQAIEKQQLSDPLSNDSQNIKKLLLPSEMGERFQVLLLGKNVTVPTAHLTMRDFRFKL